MCGVSRELGSLESVSDKPLISGHYMMGTGNLSGRSIQQHRLKNCFPSRQNCYHRRRRRIKDLKILFQPLLMSAAMMAEFRTFSRAYRSRSACLKEAKCC